MISLNWWRQGSRREGHCSYRIKAVVLLIYFLAVTVSFSAVVFAFSLNTITTSDKPSVTAVVTISETSGTLSLGNNNLSVNITASTPNLATQTSKPNEYVYFPQTLQWVGDTLLISYQNDSDALHDSGWTGGLLGSADGGKSWKRLKQPLSPNLVKSCHTVEDGIWCYEYATRKLAPNSTDATTAWLGAHHYVNTSKSSSFWPICQKEWVPVYINFPSDHKLASWGANTFLMVTDGKIIKKSGKSDGLLMLLYGDYAKKTTNEKAESSNIYGNVAEAEEEAKVAERSRNNHTIKSFHSKLQTSSMTAEKYSIVAVQSKDGLSDNWTWLSTVSHGAPPPCDNPSEHDCTYLANGTLFCVWRSDGGTLCTTSSHDNGNTWTTSSPLQSSPSPSQIPFTRPPISRACQATLNAFCNNRSDEANGKCIHTTEIAYPNITLPMYGLYDIGCAHPQLQGPCVGPETTSAAWRCYSHLAVLPAPNTNFSFK